MINIFGNFIFWTALSFVILLVFIIVAFTTHKGKRRNYKYIAIMLMLGIYLANVTFISSLIFFGNAVEWKENVSSYNDVSIKDFSKNTNLPEKNSVFYHFNTEYKIVDSEFLLRDSVLYGLIYSTKMSGLGLKYQALIPVSFYFSIFSGIFFVGLTILSPIVFGGLVASFFEGFFTFIHYFITKNFCDIYYFSDLNEKSLLLAKDIHEKQKHSLIVFCNKNKKIDSTLLQEAKYNGFVLTTRNELDFVKISKHKHCFFEMKNDEVKNVADVSSLLSEFQKLANKHSSKSAKRNILENKQIYLVAEKETSYEVINKLEKCVNVIILNRYKSAFYNLLFKKPLYECLGNRKDFSITVIGAGNCSSEIIKACAWCTQLGNDYSTKINVIDKNAKDLEKRLKKECPELISSSYNINFSDCDISKLEFNNLLETKCADTNYIIVASGSDDDNLRIAMELRRFYLSSSPEFNNLPVINVYIEDNEYLQSVQGLINSSLEDKKNNYILESFGSDKEFYSYSMFNDSDIEKLAINSSCVYWKYRKDNHPEENYTVSEMNDMYFFDKEFEKNSNRTNAIHLVYKLFLLGFGIRKKSDPSVTQEQKKSAPKLLKYLKEKLADKSKLDNLAYIEHERWNAFYRSEGWCGIPYDKWDAFKKQYNKQKNYVIKQHACICSYEMLQEVEKKFNGDYRSYDYAFMKYLTMTLGLEKEPNPNEPEINVSGVEYILVEL